MRAKRVVDPGGGRMVKNDNGFHSPRRFCLIAEYFHFYEIVF